MPIRGQAVNLPLWRRRSVANFGGLAVGNTGATSTTVLNWDDATVVTVGVGITVSSNANDATRIFITRPGVYACSFGCTLGPGTAVVGIGVDQSGPSLTQDPSYATAGVLYVATATAPAATALPLGFTRLIPITRAMAGDATGATLRFLASNGVGGAPSALSRVNAWYSVELVAEMFV